MADRPYVWGDFPNVHGARLVNMGLGTTLTLVSMLTVGGISASVWVHNEHKEIDEKNVDIVVFEEQLAGLEGYLQESELRGLKAERRGLKLSLIHI